MYFGENIGGSVLGVLDVTGRTLNYGKQLAFVLARFSL